MKDFYVTLTSNTISEKKGNTTSRFSVYLPTKLNLQGVWEVALVEIQYPHSWKNIFGRRDHGFADNWINVIFANHQTGTIYVPTGYYDTIFDLLAAIEYGKERYIDKEIEKHSEKIRNEDFDDVEEAFHTDEIKTGFIIKFDQTLQRVICNRDPEKIKSLEFSNKLQYMLGFENAGIYEETETAKYIHDLRGGFYSLFVYCSLVEPQIVGDVTAPLLRNVHIEGRHGEIVEKIFTTPHYVPVNSKEVDRIEIDIKDDNNQSVPFQFGKTVVKLHFRKKKRYL